MKKTTTEFYDVNDYVIRLVAVQDEDGGTSMTLTTVDTEEEEFFGPVVVLDPDMADKLADTLWGWHMEATRDDDD